jgi:hypothetical protein
MTDPIHGSDASAATPRWVKVFGIVAMVVVLLFVVLMFAGGGGHGPRRHLPGSDAGAHTPSEGDRR